MRELIRLIVIFKADAHIGHCCPRLKSFPYFVLMEPAYFQEIFFEPDSTPVLRWA